MEITKDWDLLNHVHFEKKKQIPPHIEYLPLMMWHNPPVKIFLYFEGSFPPIWVHSIPNRLSTNPSIPRERAPISRPRTIWTCPLITKTDIYIGRFENKVVTDRSAWICVYLPSTAQSTGKSWQLLTAVESVKHFLHKLDQCHATLMMAEPPIPPTEAIFQPSIAIVQATKIQPNTVIKNPQIWTTLIFIFRPLQVSFLLDFSSNNVHRLQRLGYILQICGRSPTQQVFKESRAGELVWCCAEGGSTRSGVL